MPTTRRRRSFGKCQLLGWRDAELPGHPWFGALVANLSFWWSDVRPERKTTFFFGEVRLPQDISSCQAARTWTMLLERSRQLKSSRAFKCWCWTARSAVQSIDLRASGSCRRVFTSRFPAGSSNLKWHNLTGGLGYLKTQNKTDQMLTGLPVQVITTTDDMPPSWFIVKP